MTKPITHEILSIATVGFLILTFRNQRAELQAANRVASVSERAEKPYVFFSVDTQFVGGTKGTTDGPHDEIVVTPVLKNYGKSPATKLHYSMTLFAQDENSKEEIIGGDPRGDQHVILAVGDCVTVPSYPRFPTSFYFDVPGTYYIVSCVYGYSDAQGNVVIRDKRVSYSISPGFSSTRPELGVINVSEMTQEELDECAMNVAQRARDAAAEGMDDPRSS